MALHILILHINPKTGILLLSMSTFQMSKMRQRAQATIPSSTDNKGEERGIEDRQSDFRVLNCNLLWCKTDYDLINSTSFYSEVIRELHGVKQDRDTSIIIAIEDR